MAKPKVSIIWVNYNSMSIIDTILESLQAIAELDYPSDRYEVIIVDNKSTDGSFKKIIEFLERIGSLRKRVVRLTTNLGYTGGNNIGFMARDPESKYVILLNNDAVPLPESLPLMVEYAEKYEWAGALNGVVLRHGSNLIDTAGGFLDELLLSHLTGSGKPYPWIVKHPFYISYADGAYVLYKVEHILRCIGNKLFVDELFGYTDDSMVGLILWNCGCSSLSIPHAVAYHVRGATFGKISPLAWYLSTRNRLALMTITNSRFKRYMCLYALKSYATPTMLRNRLYRVHTRALYDALRLGEILKRKLGRERIDVYKAPIIRIQGFDIIKYLFGPRKLIKTHHEEEIIKLINTLQVEE